MVRSGDDIPEGDTAENILTCVNLFSFLFKQKDIVITQILYEQ